MTNRDRVTSDDLLWGARQIARRMLWSLLPLEIHQYVGLTLGKIRRRIGGVPQHVRNNIEFVYGNALSEGEKQRIAREHVEFSTHMYLERILPMISGFRERGFRVVGEGYLEKGLGAGRGTLLATGHFGHGRLVGPILHALGFDVKRVVGISSKHFERNLRLLQWVESQDRFPSALVARLLVDFLHGDDIPAQLDIRPILRALEQNKLVMIAGDGLIGSDFATMPFLGHDYPFPTGFMKIAMMTGATVLPVFAFEEGSEKTVLELFPPLEIDPNASVEKNLTGYVTALETMVKRIPSQWTRWGVKRAFESARKWVDKELDGRVDHSFSQWAAGDN